MNPYYSPEQMNLEIVVSDNFGASYEFDMEVIFRHVVTGRFYYAADSGCSCPIPFEDMTIEEMDEVTPYNYLQFCYRLDSNEVKRALENEYVLR